MSWACGTSWFGWAYQVYRIDTTNVANIELVPNITYVSSTVWTYIVDDDIVINGWYFVNYSATELPEHLKFYFNLSLLLVSTRTGQSEPSEIS